jgi:tetratricopeptide (TPR) repeat protein
LVGLIENEPHVALQDTAGWVYYKLGDIDAAFEVLKRVVENAPDSPEFNYHLGMVYHAKGDKELAREHLRKAVEGDVNYQGREEAQKTLESL